MVSIHTCTHTELVYTVCHCHVASCMKYIKCDSCNYVSIDYRLVEYVYTLVLRACCVIINPIKGCIYSATIAYATVVPELAPQLEILQCRFSKPTLICTNTILWQTNADFTLNVLFLCICMFSFYVCITVCVCIG